MMVVVYFFAYVVQIDSQWVAVTYSKLSDAMVTMTLARLTRPGPDLIGSIPHRACHRGRTRVRALEAVVRRVHMSALGIHRLPVIGPYEPSLSVGGALLCVCVCVCVCVCAC